MQITDWKLKYGEYEELSCSAPCSMYSVLLDHGLIEDPFYGLNELKVTSLADKGCCFVGNFTMDDASMKKDHIEITFLGLDTICDIYVNDEWLDFVNDMHIAYTYDVKKMLTKGDNEIRLEFHSPTKYFAQENAKHFIYTNGDTIPGAAHLRKALYMSGWDWGPKLPDMGIFRPVEIRAYDSDRIDDVFVKQFHEDGQVELEISVTTKQYTAKELKDAGLSLWVEFDGQKVRLKNGKAKIKVNDPKLWWVRGYGDQYLYDLKVILVKYGKEIDVVNKRIGLRTLTVSTVPDKWGNEFCFVLNGIKIFAMGANYVPQDNILNRISKERTDKLLQTCLDANFNCLRIWGGQYYPEDDFYDLCDEYGIMLWQDFMVACANIRLTEDFEKNFVNEAIYNLKRIRHHACIGILCGNNEMEDAILHWDDAKGNELEKLEYLMLYEQILPKICEKYAPQLYYWPSSPSCGGGFDDPTDPLRGDIHYWTVWHGNVPFTDYRNHLFRFCSEYGFESFPSMKTIRTFCEEKDMNAFSRVMENHQKCKGANGKIVKYIADTYLYPTNFEKLVYTSQLLQAEAIKYGVEHFRRTRGICMGSIYWQFNDCWPVASWSSVDYYGRYKALHYAARKFYAPVAMGLFLETGVLNVNVSNESMSDFVGKVNVRLCGNDFSVIFEDNANVSVASLTAKDVFCVSMEAKDPYNNYIVVDLFDDAGNLIMSQTEMFVRPKHYEWEDPKLQAVIRQVEGGVDIAVSADVFAKGVEIDFANVDLVLSDNFFDITSKEPKHIFATTDHTAEDLQKNLILRSVYDIGK